MKKILFLFLSTFLFHFSNAQCTGFTLSNADLDFGDEATFPIPAGDIANGGNLTPPAISFDIWDETTGAVGPGGVDDITFTISMSDTFDPYGGTTNQTTSTTHDVIQDGTGIKGRLGMGNSGATSATTGDVRCYTIDVDFASHVNVTAPDITSLVSSVNTAGTAFESLAIVFKDKSLNPYGTATYNGYFSSPPTGVPGGSNPGVAAAAAWSSTGTGVYIADDPTTVDLTDPFNTASNSNGDNNPDPSATDAGLGTTFVGGFTYTVCLEDVAATANDGDITTTGTNFSSTLNGISLASVCLGTLVLPVDLVDFSADKLNNKEVELSWATASEENSDYYEIEHSVDSKNFRAIGKVKAAGNSTENIDYSFTHSNPLPQNNYYRLKQVDLDGTYAYSDIEVVNFSNNSIRVYPTLASNELNILLDTPNSLQQNISIINMAGHRLYADVMNEGETSKNVDISSLPPGQYIIFLYNNDNIATQKFIKK